MTATDETATDVAADATPTYRPRSALAHVSASQPTGLLPVPASAIATTPKRGALRR